MPVAPTTHAFSRELTDADRAGWVRFNERCRKEPRLLRFLKREDPVLYERAIAGLRLLAIEARSEEWRSPLSGVGGRPEQLMPGTRGAASDRTDWVLALYVGGRGSGKSRTGAEAVREIIEGRRWSEPPMGALVGQTLDAVRVDMFENTLLRILTPGVVRQWNRGPCELFLRNGGYLRGFSSEAARKLRGPNFHFGWADEMGTFRDANRSPRALDTTWSNLLLAVRLDDRKTWRPRIIGTTTPRPCNLIRNVDPRDPLNPGPGLYDDPRTVVTHMSTEDNLANLPASFLEAVIEPLRGTRLFEQEVLGILMDAVVGALWSSEQVQAMMTTEYAYEATGGLVRTVVAVDPSVGGGMGDECGIVVAGLGADRKVYILEDCSIRAAAPVWVKTIQTAAAKWNASAVVAEVNHGQELVGETIGRYAPNLPLVGVNAKVGKIARAEPVAILSDRGLILFASRDGHGGDFARLTSQMRTFDGTGPSPDRLDALVFSTLYLLPVETGAGDLFSVARGSTLR
jgi:phage terminase large subunit-like protein